MILGGRSETASPGREGRRISALAARGPWVDNSGLLLQLDGGIVDGKMVLLGPGKEARGNEIMNRITWTPHEDGTVQQTWSTSRDGGETWATAFDGIYSKRDN